MEQKIPMPKVESFSVTEEQVKSLIAITGKDFSFIINGRKDDLINLTLIYYHGRYDQIKPLVDEILKGE